MTVAVMRGHSTGNIRSATFSSAVYGKFFRKQSYVICIPLFIKYI